MYVHTHENVQMLLCTRYVQKNVRATRDCMYKKCKDLRTQASPQNPEDSQKHNPDRQIFSPPLLSQDAARLWMCVWHPSSNAAAARERSAAQATFDRKLSHYRHQILTFGVSGSSTAPKCRQQTVVHIQQSPAPHHTQQTSQRAATVTAFVGRIAPAQMET